MSPHGSSRSSRPELAELIAAASGERHLEGRLTGGWAWRQYRMGPRGPDPRPAPDVQIAAAHLELALGNSPAPDALAAFASGLALLGHYDRAIDALEESLAEQPRRPEWWSDLSAVYLARATREGRAIDLPLALEAAAAARRLNPLLHEAAFNRAAALEAMRLVEPAREAWQEYLALDRHSAWREESTDRIARLSSPGVDRDAQATRERLFDVSLPAWARGVGGGDAARGALGDAAALAELSPGSVEASAARALLDARAGAIPAAVALFGEARAHYSAARYASARPLFTAARSQLGNSHPLLAGWIDYYLAVITYVGSDLDETLTRLGRVETAARTELSPALLGHVHWLRGMTFVLQARHRAALEEYEASVRALSAARETANAAFVRGLTATSHEWLGDPAAAWSARLAGLAASRPGTLLNAGTSARENGWMELAAAIQQQAATQARRRRRLPDVVDALRDLAMTKARAGEREAAAAAIAEAELIVSGKTEVPFDRLRAEVALAGARCFCLPDETARTSADRAVRAFETLGLRARVPAALEARARLRLVAGDGEGARADAERALDQLELDSANADTSRLRAALGAEIRRLADVLVEIGHRAGDPVPALLAAERGRTQFAALERARPLDAAELGALAGRLPGDTAVIYFHYTDERLMTWTVRRGGSTPSRVTPMTGALRQQLKVFTRNPASVAVARALRLALLPADLRERRLILVLDGPLHLLPFAAFPGRTHAFLLEEHVLSIAPSLSWLARSAARSGGHIQSIAAFGNPARRASMGSLPDLPGAAGEAVDTASRYPRGIAIAGADATHAAVVRALLEMDAVHFAGHALLNENDPAQSLLVTADAEARPLTAGVLASMRTPRARLVVLAACSSASGVVTRAEGPIGLARALLAAGVQSVVGSLWPMDDRAAPALFAAFHRAVAAGQDVPSALREGQLQLLRSGDPQRTDPRAWAGLIAVDGIPHALNEGVRHADRHP